MTRNIINFSFHISKTILTCAGMQVIIQLIGAIKKIPAHLSKEQVTFSSQLPNNILS